MRRDLWPHLQRGLEVLRQTVGQKVRRIVLEAPTGGGKTDLAACIAERSLERKRRMAFVVSNLSLVDQTVVESFYFHGIRDIGVIQQRHDLEDWSKPIQVCSIQTIDSRGVFPEADTVLIDECHVLHEAHKRWMAACPQTVFIGLSATPYTRGLGKHFQTKIVVATTQALIDAGILCKFRVFASAHPDLSKVRVVPGKAGDGADYHEGELGKAMQEGSLIADIVDNYKRNWNKGKTLCFAVNLAHAKSLQERFIEAGVKAGYQDARTTQNDRRALKRAFHSGEVDVAVNVGTLTTGTDWDVRALILARPTRSEILYKQIVGRALRRADGKDYAMIFDHTDTTGGNGKWAGLGFVTDIHHDELDNGEKRQRGETKRTPPRPKECPQCSVLNPPGWKKCPNCGFDRRVVSGILEAEGRLVEVTSRGDIAHANGKGPKSTSAQKMRFWRDIQAYALHNGKSPKFALACFRERFGEWPHWSIKHLPPAAYPSMDTLVWVKHRAMLYAKKMKREERQRRMEQTG